MKRKVTICCVALAMAMVSLLSGCTSADGDPYLYAGIGVGIQNMELTTGKEAGKSPTRGPSKNRRGTVSRSGTTITGANGFARD